jgi:hypothetical protein
VWDLLDDAFGEESKFCLLVRDGVVEGNDAFLYDGDAFGEELVGKCSRTGGVSKETESAGEIDWDSRCGCVIRMRSCRECCYCVGNSYAKFEIGGGDERQWGRAIAGGDDPCFCRVYEAAEGWAIGFECVAEEFKIGEVDTGRDVVDIR